ncbi:MAG TPA: 23S rRNA (guanosine(2251)-2'-O)-methyltransferase RlmB [Acidimicrobiales bacterium]|nr:23S rRNA (guanosine(2251)-2'-O)-methyltransferase RlmB [Acidimicrobiales bacterium]
MTPSRPVRRPSAPQQRWQARREGDLGGDQVEGRRAVLELLVAKRRHTRRVVLADAQESSPQLDAIEEAARRARVPVAVVSRARLDREARTEGNQGVYALCDPVAVTPLEALCEGGTAPFLLVCDGVTDPRNLGALLRSAECAGVSGVVLPTHRAARLTPAVTKTAAGAIEHLDFCAVGGIPSALATLSKRGVRTVGLAPESKRSLYDLDLADTAVALVIGGEERGLGRLVRTRCDDVVSIPQLGAIESLNAAVAGAVACFEVARQRRARRHR